MYYYKIILLFKNYKKIQVIYFMSYEINYFVFRIELKIVYYIYIYICFEIISFSILFGKCSFEDWKYTALISKVISRYRYVVFIYLLFFFIYLWKMLILKIYFIKGRRISKREHDVCYNLIENRFLKILKFILCYGIP